MFHFLKFNIHVEKVIEIVQNVPTAAICHQVVFHLLNEELKIASDEEIQMSTDISSELKMLQAVLTSITPNLAYGSLASALLSIITEDDAYQTKQNIITLCGVLESIANLLGDHYDGYLLVNAMMNHQICKNTKSDFFLIARLVFECITLMVPPSMVNTISHERSRSKGNNKILNEMILLEHQGLNTLPTKLLDIRKNILRWCLSSYNFFGKEKQTSEENGSMKLKLNEPIFTSVLDGETNIVEENESGNSLFNAMKCLLFLTDPESPCMCSLLQLGLTNGGRSEPETLTEEKLSRIRVCMKYGSSVDNDVFKIIIQSVVSETSSISAQDAISLMEQLLNQCSKSDQASVLVDDYDVIWDLYKLTEYKPRMPNTNTSIDIPKYVAQG